MKTAACNKPKTTSTPSWIVGAVDRKQASRNTKQASAQRTTGVYSSQRPGSSTTARTAAIYDLCELDPMAERIG